MTYHLYVGKTLKACTASHKWLVDEAIPFHRRWSCGLPIVIAAFADSGDEA